MVIALRPETRFHLSRASRLSLLRLSRSVSSVSFDSLATELLAIQRSKAKGHMGQRSRVTGHTGFTKVTQGFRGTQIHTRTHRQCAEEGEMNGSMKE